MSARSLALLPMLEVMLREFARRQRTKELFHAGAALFEDYAPEPPHAVSCHADQIGEQPCHAGLDVEQTASPESEAVCGRLEWVVALPCGRGHSSCAQYLAHTHVQPCAICELRTQHRDFGRLQKVLDSEVQALMLCDLDQIVGLKADPDQPVDVQACHFCAGGHVVDVLGHAQVSCAAQHLFRARYGLGNLMFAPRQVRAVQPQWRA